MRFRDSCSTEYLFKWQYIAFFRAYLDTILKALLSTGQQTNPAIHWSNHVHVGQKFKLFL